MDGGSLLMAVAAVGVGVVVGVITVAAVWFARGWRFRLLRYRARSLLRRAVRGLQHGAFRSP
jgi:amino acid permease